MRWRKRGTRIFVPREIWDKYLLHGVREPERPPAEPRKPIARGRIFEPRRGAAMSEQLTLDGSRQSGALLSDDGVYRYHLWRRWAEGRSMIWVMVNPSTADAETDDPTIRRCMGFARREGCGGIDVINLFALRSKDPSVLKTHPDPNGPDNPDTWLGTLDPTRGPIVVGWGGSVGKKLRARSTAYAAHGALLMGLGRCLGKTKAGEPLHPLFIEGDRPLELWRS